MERRPSKCTISPSGEQVVLKGRQGIYKSSLTLGDTADVDIVSVLASSIRLRAKAASDTCSSRVFYSEHTTDILPRTYLPSKHARIFAEHSRSFFSPEHASLEKRLPFCSSNFPALYPFKRASSPRDSPEGGGVYRGRNESRVSGQ